MLQFSELFQWSSAAEFIADHLNYELLEPAHELVSYSNELDLYFYFLSSRKHFGHRPKFLLINVETVSIMPIFYVQC